MVRRKKLITSLVVFFCLLVFLLLAFNTALVTRYYSIESSKVDAPVRIAFIADLHSCDYGEGQTELIEAIAKESPDLVLLGGDIVDDVLPQEKATEFLSAISQRYPCYYVSGNHEYWSGDIDEIKDMIEGYGITVLAGDCATVTANGQTLNICGIDDPEAGEDTFSYQLESAASKLDGNTFSLLLSHRPERIEQYLAYDFDLILSGHAHGGQWRIPGILNGLYAPNQGWFPAYAGGQYQFETTAFIVSRGLARESTGIPRIFNRPELVIITIQPQ